MRYIIRLQIILLASDDLREALSQTVVSSMRYGSHRRWFCQPNHRHDQLGCQLGYQAGAMRRVIQEISHLLICHQASRYPEALSLGRIQAAGLPAGQQAFVQGLSG